MNPASRRARRSLMSLWRSATKRAIKVAGDGTPLGLVLYEGPSELDGQPIVVIATGLGRSSKNEKTGDMVQVWILRSDIAPHHAVRSGADVSVCGDCKHRGTTCYVVTFQGPREVWAAYKRGRYLRVSYPEAMAYLAGARVRFGAYGDPSAAPLPIWQAIASVASGWTGYTHQWRHLDGRWHDLVMASVDSPSEYLRAKSAGWRAFLVQAEGAAPIEGTRRCPAISHGMECADCRACDGTARGARRPDIAIEVHGSGAASFAA